MSNTKSVEFQNVSRHFAKPYIVTIPDLCHRMTVAREACEEVTLAASVSGYLNTVGAVHETHVVGDPNGAPSSVLVTISCTDGSAVDLEWDPIQAEWVVSVANDGDMTDDDIVGGLHQILRDLEDLEGDADACARPLVGAQTSVLRAAIARISGL